MAARWEFGDGKAKEPTGVIDIQLYPKRSATNVKQLVQKEAKRLGGQILAESVELGGLEAFQFIIPPKSPGNETANPLRARFIKHGNIYLALVERVATEKTTAAAFDQIAKEMQLGSPCEPSEALRDRGQPIELRG